MARIEYNERNEKLQQHCAHTFDFSRIGKFLKVCDSPPPPNNQNDLGKEEQSWGAHSLQFQHSDQHCTVLVSGSIYRFVE